MQQNEANNGSKKEPSGKSLDTAAKQQRIDRLKPYRFKKGQSGNPNGRPKSFDELRARAQLIAHEELPTKTGGTISVADAILRSWAKDPKHQRDFIEYAFGKVPDKIDATGLENKTTLILHWPHERPDLATNGSENVRS